MYDENDNMIERQSIRSDDNLFNIKTIYEYNDKGQETKETCFDLPTSDPNKYVFSHSITRKYEGENLTELFVYNRG